MTALDTDILNDSFDTVQQLVKEVKALKERNQTLLNRLEQVESDCKTFKQTIFVQQDQIRQQNGIITKPKSRIESDKKTHLDASAPCSPFSPHQPAFKQPIPSPSFKILHVGRENITLLVSCPSDDLIVSADRSIVVSSDLLSYLCVLFEERMIGTLISLTTPQKQDRRYRHAHPINRTSLTSSGCTVSVVSRREVVVSPYTPTRLTKDNGHRMPAKIRRLKKEEARMLEQLTQVQAELEALSNRTNPASITSRSHPRRHTERTNSSHTSRSSLSSNEKRPSHTQHDHAFDHHRKQKKVLRAEPSEETDHSNDDDVHARSEDTSSDHESMHDDDVHARSEDTSSDHESMHDDDVHARSEDTSSDHESMHDDDVHARSEDTSSDHESMHDDDVHARSEDTSSDHESMHDDDVHARSEDTSSDHESMHDDDVHARSEDTSSDHESMHDDDVHARSEDTSSDHESMHDDDVHARSEDTSSDHESMHDDDVHARSEDTSSDHESMHDDDVHARSEDTSSDHESMHDDDVHARSEDTSSDHESMHDDDVHARSEDTSSDHESMHDDDVHARSEDTSSDHESMHDDDVHARSEDTSSDLESCTSDKMVESSLPPEPRMIDDHSQSGPSPTYPRSTPVTTHDSAPHSTSDGDTLDIATFSLSSASSSSRPDRDLHPFRWIQEQLKREEHSKTQKQNGRRMLASPLTFNATCNNLSAKLGLSPRNTRFVFDMRAHPVSLTLSDLHTPSTPKQLGDQTANVSILKTPKVLPQWKTHRSRFDVTPSTPKSFWQNFHETESRRRETNLYGLFGEWEKKMNMCRDEIGLLKREYSLEKKKLAALAQMDAEKKERTAGFESRMEEEDKEARKHEMTEIVRKMVELKDRAKGAKRNLLTDLQRIESDVRRECSESNRRLQQFESQRMLLEKVKNEPEENRMTNEELANVLEKRKGKDENVAVVSMPVTPRSHSTLKVKRAEDKEEEQNVDEQQSTPVRPAALVTEPVVLTPQHVDHLLTSAVSNEQTVLLLSQSQTVHSVLHTLYQQHFDHSLPREGDEEPDADGILLHSHSPAFLEMIDLSDMSDMNSPFPTLDALQTPFDLPVLTENISPREQESKAVENVKTRKDKAQLEESIKQHNEEEQKKRMGAQDDSPVSPHKATVSAPSNKDEVILGSFLSRPVHPVSPLRIRRSETVQVDCRFLLRQYLASAHFVSLYADTILRQVEQESKSLPLYGADEQVDWSYSDLDIFEKASKSPPPTIQNPKQRHFFLPAPEEIDVAIFDTVNPEVHKILKEMVDQTVQRNTEANLLLPPKDKQTPHFEILPNSVPSSEEIKTIVNQVTFPLFDTFNEKLGFDRRELVKQSQLSEAVTMSLWRKDLSGQLSQDELSSPFMKLHVPSQSSPMKHAPLFILRLAQLTFHYLVFQACLPLNHNTITSIVNRYPSALSGDESLIKDQQSFLLKQAPVRLETSILSYALLLPPLSPSAQWILTQMEEDEPQLKLSDEEKLYWISAGQERETPEVAQEQNVDLLVSDAVLNEEQNDWDIQVMSDLIVEVFVEEIATDMIDDVLDEVGMDRGERDPEYDEEEREPPIQSHVTGWKMDHVIPSLSFFRSPFR
ncbi:hypothetical protein BLNAU_5116 [Blattamonas nauphoetae]|uniref:Uncharacterized protein n=1 Tax=Blattamonas nauphoetae TaxID=2049346 RepID=A0ABQ9Y899_9EUKA|nr:hypothetical protein BLNAU_5116 [Blattamonas nauphoetae]